MSAYKKLVSKTDCESGTSGGYYNFCAAEWKDVEIERWFGGVVLPPEAG